MANPKHVKKLKEEGVEAWNKWIIQNREVRPDLYMADLRKANLRGAYLIEASLSQANLSEANLSGANLGKADLISADLRKANLSEAHLGSAYLIGASLFKANLSDVNLYAANLSEANLSGADLSRAHLGKANLSGADLSRANLSEAGVSEANLISVDLSGADLSGADLSKAVLVGSNCEGAVLSNCNVYGMSVWDIDLTNAIQSNLVITPWGQPEIQVDNLQVAQFIYLLLNNQNVRDVIDTITSKTVLILGRFTTKRKPVLEFSRCAAKPWPSTDTVRLRQAAHSDNGRNDLHAGAHVPLRHCRHHRREERPSGTALNNSQHPFRISAAAVASSQEEPGMWDFFRKFPWVLEPVKYSDQDALIAMLDQKVIAPADAKTLPGTPPGGSKS